MSNRHNIAANVLTVSQLTFRIKDALEQSFPMVWICGEISNFAMPQSGHVYLTMKDDHAQIRAVIWRTTAQQLPFELEDGLEVVAQGAIDIYPPRGSYQLIIRQIEPLGLGPLELAYRQLFQRLSEEGLFDKKWKKPPPKFPRRIAIVTSPTGAAVRDFLQVIDRRWRSANVVVIPSRVQGEGAAQEIAAGIRYANNLTPRPDVLVVARGGGSMEDLWCFNEEIVVRAVFHCDIPVISGVGHEIDVTLTDLAADLRAATPTEAAEYAAPSRDEARRALDDARQRIDAAMKTTLNQCRARLEAVEDRQSIRRPFDRFHEGARRTDELEMRLRQAARVQLQKAKERTDAASLRLHALSPFGVLSRGYSVTKMAETEAIIRSAGSLSLGWEIVTQFADGRCVSRVVSVNADNGKSQSTVK